MTGTPATEYLFKVSTPADPNYGATATLEIEFERPAYLNALQLAPFSTFPLHLKAIDTQGFTADTRANLFTGSVELDRPMTIRFERQLVRGPGTPLATQGVPPCRSAAAPRTVRSRRS